MEIRILGAHNCESQTTRCTSILIDEKLAIDAGGLTATLPFASQQKLMAILLTHQHYDHIRDIPMIAFNMHQWQKNIQIYCTPEVRETIESNLLNGIDYPEFHKIPIAEPTISFKSFNPYEPENVEGYSVLALPVKHAVPTVGYQVSDGDSKTIFYTSDTGPELSSCWEKADPELLLIDVTKPDSQRMFASYTGHLTPSLLHDELINFHELKGYLPQVVVIHMDPMLEQTIADELVIVAQGLKISITLAHEGMCLSI